MTWNTRIKGMTLIEVVVAVAIVAILSAIAIPAYGSYTTRSRVERMLGACRASQDRRVDAFDQLPVQSDQKLRCDHD